MVGAIEYPLVNPDEMAGEAWAAMDRRDAGEALRLWQALRRDFPERADGYVWPIQLLWQGGRVDEAEALAAEAFARFPEDPELLVQYGWLAMARERWDEALRWWAIVRERAPGRVEGYLWAARALWKLARFDEAETLAEAGLHRFAGNVDLETEAAVVAVNRRDWNAALHRWRRVLAIAPGRSDALVGAIQAMRWLGQADAAEEMATEAVAIHPGDPDLLSEYIWAAVGRGDWPSADARLTAGYGVLQAVGRFDGIRAALEARRPHGSSPLAVTAAVAPPSASETPSTGDETETRDLMLSFESIGERCDFGGVQRRYGVEPLGLLRFAFAPLEPLIAALDERFEAIGTVQDTEFDRYQDEAILRMRKYALYFHTFVSMSGMPTPEKQAAFREQQLRRLVFLKRKLISDLEEPQKICVYANDTRTSDDDALRLFAALRRYGPNSLLFARPVDADHPEGMLRTLADGLYVATYPGLTDFVGGQHPPYEFWRHLCERVYRMELDRAGPGPLRR